jgi:general nucleoside transport system permease protein
VLAASVLISGVQVGADSMSRNIAVPTYLADVMVATALLATLVATMLVQYRVRWRL